MRERAKRRERRIYVGLGGVLVGIAAVTAILLTSAGTSPRQRSVVITTAAPATTSAGPSALLAANARQANQVLDTTIQAKLAQLPGVPVVVNQWASWCPNCRFEFRFFQQAARQDVSRVAFVGLDSQDSQSDAQAFLQKFPVNYPSVFDPSASQAQSLGAGQSWPTTIFLDGKHQVTNIHVGAYPTLQALQQDITRYT